MLVTNSFPFVRSSDEFSVNRVPPESVLLGRPIIPENARPSVAL